MKYAESLLGHGVPTERRRLQLMQELLDPHTERIITGLGIAPGWRCLEAGAGDGSIARWLGARCPDGRVVATDLDLDYLEGTVAPPVELLRHDVVRDAFPPASFDLIHARMLLVNVPERASVIPRMVEWLAPGGWLVIEDPDTAVGEQSGYPALRTAMRAVSEIARTQGADPCWARTLPPALAAAGLVDVGTDITVLHAGNGAAGSAFYRAFLDQLSPALLATGLLTAAELDAALALLDDPAFCDGFLATVSVWARRPLRA